MIKKIDISNRKVAQQVLNIQIPSYLVEAELIQFHDIPALKDTVETLQKCEETFYGYFVDGEVAGVISYKVENNTLDIHRLMVTPSHFRKGIGQSLLGFVEIRESDIDQMIVSTGAKNFPAQTLYTGNGFVLTGEREISEGVFVSRFCKKVK